MPNDNMPVEEPPKVKTYPIFEIFMAIKIVKRIVEWFKRRNS